MNHLPVETLEHVIRLIPNTNDADERWTCRCRSTVLTCALVSKTWAPVARRRLLSLYFPEGRVKITSEPIDVLKFVDILQAPLRTLDPTFFRVLCCTSSRKPPQEIGVAHELFFVVLSVVDASLLPSLQKIELDGPLFSNVISDDFTASSESVFFQIKSLVISPPQCPSLKNILHTVRLFPFVEELALQSDIIRKIPSRLYQELSPPTSLRKLVVDVPALCKMATWLTLCQPVHALISSLTICELTWNDHCSDYQVFLNQIGPNLEELVLDLCDWEDEGDFVADNPDGLITRFAQNVQLRRLTLQGTAEVLVGVALYLLQQAQFAPELEILNITFREFYQEEGEYLIKFKLLDDYVHTRRPSLRQIVISSKEAKSWEDVKFYTRKYLPRCEEKGMLELKLSL